MMSKLDDLTRDCLDEKYAVGLFLTDFGFKSVLTSEKIKMKWNFIKGCLYDEKNGVLRSYPSILTTDTIKTDSKQIKDWVSNGH